MTVQDIYKIIDGFAPFSTQEAYDRSGLLTGDPAQEVTKIMLTLDITRPVVEEAAARGADLILAHHPVIWEPLRSISPAHPVWHMVQGNIAGICAHTNLDIAEGGLNDLFGELLAKEVPFAGSPEPLAVLSGGRTLGRSAPLESEWDGEALAEALKKVFRCQNVRCFFGENAEHIRKIAWCTGSGAEFIPDAVKAGADAYITGDCKHSTWMDAQNLDLTLFDCGHFHSEVIAVRLFERILRKVNPTLEIIQSDTGRLPPYICF